MRKALGKGLDALFPGQRSPGEALHQQAVGIDEIVPNPDQPRRHFDEEALTTLADSIARRGLLQPLLVRRVAGRYELIAGERRLRAARRAGIPTVPVIVRDAPAEERLELALIENLLRENLTPLEEAEAYQQLLERHELTHDELASRVGKSRPAITNALRLLALPEAVKAQVESGKLSAGHARAVLTVEGRDAQVAFAREIVTEQVPKSEAERRAAARRARPPRRAGGGAADLHVRGVAEELTRGLGTRVQITRRARGGAIEIQFYSDGELDRLVERLRIAAASRT